MSKTSWQSIDVRLFAVAASLLLSLFAILTSDIPNDDAYTYIRTADIFLEQGLGAATEHYTWVGYSFLIGIVSKLGLPLFAAAYVLNSILYALIVYSFTSIVQTIEKSEAIVWLSALIILVYPELNEYRDMVIRDIGFWGLALFGLWQFILYLQKRQLKHGIAFCLALGLAIVFRAEAIAYLALTPFSLLFDNSRSSVENRKSLLRILAVVAGFVILGALALLATGVNVFAQALEFVSVYQPFLMNALSPSEAAQAAMGNAIFGEYASTFSREYVIAVVAVGLLVVLFMTMFYAISGPYFWLVVFGWYRNHLPKKTKELLPIFAYFLVNTIIILTFLYITRYLDSRYAVILGLMVASLVPFVTHSIVERNRGTGSEQVGTYVLVFFFVFCAIDSYISFGKPKGWLLDSATYLSDNTPAQSSVLTNNHTIAYYSGRVEDYDEVERMLTADAIERMNAGDIIAIELFYEMSRLLEDPAVSQFLSQIATYPADEPRVAIYSRVNP